jgi:orotate phosphoribosyltransferase
MMSPVYIDCRKLISYPRIRSAVMDFAAGSILSEAGFEQFDCVAGGETAGIPFAAFLAERLGLPMIYVRKKPKGHGRNAQIEGELREGSRVLVIEDLTTAGGSMFTFIDAIRAAGCTVDHGIALVLLRYFEEAGRRGSPMAMSSCIISPPGAMCWQRRPGRRPSIPRHWPLLRGVSRCSAEMVGRSMAAFPNCPPAARTQDQGNGRRTR